MAGLEDLMEKERARWTKAERYSRGFADLGLGESLRLYYTRFFPAGTLLVVGLVVGVSALLPGPVDWTYTLRYGIWILAFAAMIGGLVYNAKRLRHRVELGEGLSVLPILEPAEQKLITRAISGKAPLRAEHALIARAVAVEGRKQDATQLLLAPFFICPLGSLGIQAEWYMLGLLALVGAFVSYFVVDFRRKGRFLARTASAAPHGEADGGQAHLDQQRG